MIMIFWDTLFSPMVFRVGLVPAYFKGNVEAISVTLLFLSWFFYYYYFDRNQPPLCKYFDGKSLAISHNSMNSIRFLARSKFHENQHPESVSRGNMHTFLLGLLHPDLPWSRPLWFVLFPQMIELFYNFGCSSFGCPVASCRRTGEVQGDRRRGGMDLEEHVSDPCQNPVTT